MIDQFFTPTWAAELLFRRHFADAGRDAVIADPSCGDGRFLMAIPDHVDAYGVEIDPATAREAIENSGREVLVGDFRDINLPRRPTPRSNWILRVYCKAENDTNNKIYSA